MAKSIMIQGTGSNIGKSMLVAGMARAYMRRGISVAPFKPQNMSNNAAVTVDGGEIGRAQALQARAAGIEPRVDMNPILLKPESDTGAQVIVQGKRFATLMARDYGKAKQQLLPKVMQSYHRLADEFDLILVEGAGSPAEINLRAGDIANMGFAEVSDIPVVLAADIDRGGVIAQIVGTHSVLNADDRSRIKAFIINKFRGDPSLFDDGLVEIVKRTGWQSLGVLPWFSDAWKLPGEDIMDIRSTVGGPIKIAVPRLARIANFDDLDPLACEPDVSIDIIEPGQALPGDANLILIPGSKNTISDLAGFRINGWDIDLAAHVRRGGHVLGLCAGYQMLGTEIADPAGIEGVPGSVSGLALLDVKTRMSPQKQLSLTQARYLKTGDPVSGYEIHIGSTQGPDCDRAWLSVGGQPVGAASKNGKIRGCYLHGIFSNDKFRRSFLAEIGTLTENIQYGATVDATLDNLADHLEQYLDLEALLNISGGGQ
ncbi:MAG: cobyric acid synthase [Paracoccaceae bacterium]